MASSANTIRTRRAATVMHGVVALALLLTVAGCSSTNGATAFSNTDTPTLTTQRLDPEESADAAQTDTSIVATADGGQLDWNSLEGRDVVLWFWAPW